MNKEAIVSYIAQGFKPEAIATILGCTPQYISEVQTEAWYPEALIEAKKKVKQTEEQEKLEGDYIKLESSVLSNIKEQMPFADFKDLVRLTEVLIRRKQTNVPTGGIVFNDNRQQTVLLQIPSAVAPEIVLNNKREVVAIGSQTLAPMPIHGVRKLFEKIKDDREEPARIEETLAAGRILDHVPADF